jgi:hypothetical protein
VAARFNGFANCEHQQTRDWRCNVVSSEQSDGWGPYDVEVAGNCWHGHLTSKRDRSGPIVISGCLGAWDQIRAADRLGLNALDPPRGYY